MPTVTGLTLCYDSATETWHQVTDTAGDYFKIVNAVELNGVYYGQHATDGYIYKFTGSQDEGVDYPVIARTSYADLGTAQRKRVRAMSFNGDLSAGEALSVRYSDNDFGNWSQPRSVTVSPRTKSWNWGSFFRRAYEISYTGPSDMRLFEVEIEAG